MNIFSTSTVHSVTCANINFYTVPLIHPKRTMHEHDFIYLLDGEWTLGQNNNSYHLTKDSLLILFAGNKHYGVTPCSAGTKTMYFHATWEDGDIFEPNTATPFAIETYMDVADNLKIKRLFENVVNAKLSGEHRQANLYFELLLCELRNMKSHYKENDLAQKIKSIIHAYPEKFFSNAELAHMANISVKTVETKFKSAFGKTIHQYILEFKIREAMSYFEKFDKISVKEVAYNLGFCDEYHFSKQFTRYAGISPVKYKKSLAKNLNTGMSLKDHRA